MEDFEFENQATPEHSVDLDMLTCWQYFHRLAAWKRETELIYRPYKGTTEERKIHQGSWKQ